MMASNEEEDVEDYGQDEYDEEDGDLNRQFCFSYLHEQIIIVTDFKCYVVWYNIELES